MRSLYFGSHPRSVAQAIAARNPGARHLNRGNDPTPRDIVEQFDEVDKRDRSYWGAEFTAYEAQQGKLSGRG